MFLASVAQHARLVGSVLLMALAPALSAADVTAQSLTFSGRQIKTGGQYQLTADLNGDGRADIATAGLDVEVLLTGVTKGDFNNDAKLDLAGSMNDTVEVGVLLGNGDGTATSARTNATMPVLVTSTGQIIGTLANDGGGRYSATLKWTVNPQNVTARSSSGGSASGALTLK